METNVFDRKADLTKCINNFALELKLLTSNHSLSTFDDFKSKIKRKVSIGTIEPEHTRPFIWNLMLNETTWKTKTTPYAIITEHISQLKQYKSKLKLISTKKKFNKDPLGNSSDVIYYNLL